jgi:hypothetical protein
MTLAEFFTFTAFQACSALSFRPFAAVLPSSTSEVKNNVELFLSKVPIGARTTRLESSLLRSLSLSALLFHLDL